MSSAGRQSGQRVLLEPAFILHQRPYRDSSLLIEVFSEQYGRLGLVARGGRKKAGGWKALLQPFMPLLLSWSGKGELGTLTDAEMAGGYKPLIGQVLLSGFYINELFTRLLHRHDPYPELFKYYSALIARLSSLDEGNKALQQQLRLFEKFLLDQIGYGLVLEYESVNGDMVEPNKEYYYRLGEGPVEVAFRERSGDMQGVISGRSLLALGCGVLDDAQLLKDAKRLLRRALDQQLGGRPLNSRKLLNELQRSMASGADNK